MNITLLGREANLILLHLFGWRDKNVMQGERVARKSVHLCRPITHFHLFIKEVKIEIRNLDFNNFTSFHPLPFTNEDPLITTIIMTVKEDF